MKYMIPTKHTAAAICHDQKRVINIMFRPALALQSIVNKRQYFFHWHNNSKLWEKIFALL